MKLTYILEVWCVSGDDVQVEIHRREDIAGWIRKLDHEGANWWAVEHTWRDNEEVEPIGLISTRDITDEIVKEMEDAGTTGKAPANAGA